MDSEACEPLGMYAVVACVAVNRFSLFALYVPSPAVTIMCDWSGTRFHHENCIKSLVSHCTCVVAVVSNCDCHVGEMLSKWLTCSFPHSWPAPPLAMVHHICSRVMKAFAFDDRAPVLLAPS